MPNDTDKINAFLKGPDFLCNYTYPNFEKPTDPASEEEITEIKSPDMLIGATQDGEKTLLQRLGERYSNYDKFKRAAVYLQKYALFETKQKFTKEITGEDLNEMTTKIIADHQARYFQSE